jgi:membrane-associated phospholipid phosphatase
MDTDQLAAMGTAPAAPDALASGSASAKSWDWYLASTVSHIGSPPLLAATMMALLAWQHAMPAAWAWAAVYLLFAILLPVIFLALLVHAGRVTDMEVQVRRERPVPLVMTLALGWLTTLLLAFGGAPLDMVVVSGALWVQTAVVLVITLLWKISMHCATAAAAATLAWYLLGSPLPLIIGVPLVAWSRVWLGRHTVAQALAGGLLGLGVFGAAAWLVHRL